ncbi:TonB-dependent receptor [Balneolaceae bacterium YR4-1]|uniref:TonB-dependent receptor n=1 Tax=Halalkalibaculum roseum TaxID=2709311 RepID=A0A6M1TB32_9BACT|nr:TonB-dependent receptor [Halalkalibaculum roseum]NGP77353.1 TonB-dependent receptor [Halalkalibaculum roseum]
MNFLKERIFKVCLVILGLILWNSPTEAQRLSSLMKVEQQSHQKVQIERGMTFTEALKIFEKQYKVVFLYHTDVITDKKVTRPYELPPKVDQALSTLFTGQGIEFKNLNPKTYAIFSKNDERFTSETPIIHRVDGIVTDAESGEALIGVNVVVKGTTNGVATNLEGRYSLETSSPQDTLVFSYIGYQKLEVPIEGRSQVDVSLQQQTLSGEELVVVGYGSSTRSDVTGSVSSVSVNQNEANRHNSVSSLLQGKAAGVVVKTTSGQPGSTVDVNIRGVSSLRGDNQPLYVVDGVIMNSSTDQMKSGTGEFGTEQAPQDALTGINPNDIKDIQILKDASATAIYGSRGANGVVLITTKTGQQGRTNVEYNGSTELGRVSNDMPMLDPLGYARYQNEYNQLQGFGDAYYIRDDGNIQPYDRDGGADSLAPVATPINWQDDILRTSVSQQHRISITGALEKTNYFFAAGYNKQEGIVENTGLQQGDFRLNLDRDVGDNLQISTRLTGMFRKNDQTQGSNAGGGTRFSIIRQMLGKAPLLDNFQEDQEYDLELEGPRAWLQGYDDLSEETRFIGGLKANYDISSNFNYILRLGGTVRNKTRKTWYGTELFVGEEVNGLAANSTLDYFGYNIDSILRFNGDLGENHNLRATLVGTFDRRIKKDASVEGHDFFSEALRADGIGFANSVFPYEKENRRISVLSGLARLNYRLYNNYLVTASLRADGSSKFTEGNKWGFFPSFAVAWRAGNEQFIKDLDLFSELKIRAGWGITGSQSLQPYQTLTPYNYAPYPDASNSLEAGAALSSLANEDLTWETTTQYNAGIDFGFWNNQLNGSLDIYYKETKDLLQRISLGPSSGFDNFFVNRGSIANKGVELALNGNVIQKKDFTINVGGNISFNRNEILDLGLSTGDFGGRELEAFLGSEVSGGSYFKTPANIFAVGQPVGVFWGYQTDGIIQTQEEAQNAPTYQGITAQAGDIKYIDRNGDGNIDPNDKTIIGDPNPDYSFGINSSITYKNISLDFYIDAIQNFDIANGNLLREAYAEGNAENIRSEAYYDAWRPDNQDGAYPRIGYTYRGDFPDFIVEDGSFIRLSNVTLSYNVPVSKISFLRGLNVYTTGNNLVTITDYSGWDPEVNAFPWDGTRIGVDYNTYPKMKSIIFGVNLKF